MSTIFVTSFYGSFIIPETETVAIYTTEEKRCDRSGNTVDADDPDAFSVADLIFETTKQRFIFPNLYLGLDCMLEINACFEAFCHSSTPRNLHIDINRLCDFVDVDLIGSKSIIVENK